MRSFCVRQGQVEVGVIEHEGRDFAALGATVEGCHVTAYTRSRNGEVTLTSWCGDTKLACRSEITETFWTGTCAIVFSLTNRRFIVGYALADDGALFRGELVTDCSLQEARQKALELADHWAEIDAQDEYEYESMAATDD